jgi:hypothetical protein
MILTPLLLKYKKHTIILIHLFFVGISFSNHHFFLVLQYFTDPISHLVFRTKKSAHQHFWTQKNHKDGTWPTRSVTKKYFSDKCKDLLGKYPCSRYFSFNFSNY